ERARFYLAMEAIKRFHTGVSQDLLLKEPQFHRLRTKLLGEAREFYGRLETELGGHTDSRSRQAMVRAYDELAELNKDIGTEAGALDAHLRELALRRELARSGPIEIEAQKETSRCIMSVGALQFRTGNVREAMAAYDEARAFLERIGRSADPRSDVPAQLALCGQ